MPKVERILHAAVVAPQKNMIFIGKCHADCFQQALYMGVGISAESKHQGFMTSTGRYVSRAVAARIAFNSGQIKKNTGALISEELWHDQGPSSFKYDYIKGYYKD